MKCKVRRKKILPVKVDQTLTVRLDSEQARRLMEDLTQSIEWATNRIVDEAKPSIVPTNPQSAFDGFSFILKSVIGFPIVIFGIAVVWFLFQNAAQLWNEGAAQQFAVVLMGILGLDCVLLGIEVLREKDRNYVVALFSALVSLVALIVAFIR